jgi:hypothetical protein
LVAPVWSAVALLPVPTWNWVAVLSAMAKTALPAMQQRIKANLVNFFMTTSFSG